MIDIEQHTAWQPRVASKMPGLTEYVIRTRQAYRPLDVEKAYRTLAPEFYQSHFVDGEHSVPKSYMGVPMLVEGRVLGIVELYDYCREEAYSEDDLEVLQVIANYAAVAIENAGLYENLFQSIEELKNAQQEIANKERALVITTMAADFVHKVNNLAGTLPNWVALARKKLDGRDARDEQILHYLDRITHDSSMLFQEARRLADPLPSPEAIDVYELIGSICGQMELITSPDIKIELQSEFDLHPVCAVRTQIADAVYNVLDNGIRAIAGAGRISINLRKDSDLPDEFLVVEITDTGCGMSSEKLNRIFELGRTYRGGGEGIGYGLWRTRTIVESIGGSISASSEIGKGTTFSIRLPIISHDEAAQETIL